jgi:hypothetical protein
VVGLDNRGVRTADVTVFVSLVCVQFAGVGIALLSVLVLPMSIDNCAYQTCGDEKWINYAIWTALASLAPAGVFTGIGVIQLVRNRIGFWLALIGVVAQWSLLYGAWRMADWAGPVAG